MHNHNLAGCQPASDSCMEIKSSSRVLAIGDLESWARSSNGLPTNKDVLFADLDKLDEPFLKQVSPQLVLTPVVTRQFDCLDVAYRLQELEYAGAYRAIVRDMPNPSMIRKEVRSLYPTLDFDVLDLSDPKLSLL